MTFAPPNTGLSGPGKGGIIELLFTEPEVPHSHAAEPLAAPASGIQLRAITPNDKATARLDKLTMYGRLNELIFIALLAMPANFDTTRPDKFPTFFDVFEIRSSVPRLTSLNEDELIEVNI